MKPGLSVYTTIHPGALPYLGAFADSLRRQAATPFDLWIGLDGVPEHAAQAALGPGLQPRWIPAAAGASPGRLRQQALEILVERYSAVVFVDADDVLLPGRVAAAERALEHADVDVCALRLIDATGKDLGLSLVPEPRVIEDERLAWRNVVGLSNSAYRSEVLRGCLPIPDACRIVDWLLATRARDQEARFHVDPEPRMQYRLHGANAAPILPPLDAATLERGVGMVLDHYRLLLEGKPRLREPTRTAIARAGARVESFRAALAQDATLAARYLAALNARPAPFLWWEWVAHPDLEPLWQPA